MSEISINSLSYLTQYGYVTGDLDSDKIIDSYTSTVIQPNSDVYKDSIHDFNQDGNVDYRQITLEDKNGRLKTLEIDNEGDGIFDEYNEYSYDSMGKITQIIIKKDLDKNGEYEFHEMRGYNQGYISRHAIDINNDGEFDYDKGVMYKEAHPGLKQVSMVRYSSDYYNHVRETGSDYESLNPNGGMFDHKYATDMEYNINLDQYYENGILRSETKFDKQGNITKYTEYDINKNESLIATPNVDTSGKIISYSCDTEKQPPKFLFIPLGKTIPVPDGKPDFQVETLEDFQYFQKNQ